MRNHEIYALSFEPSIRYRCNPSFSDQNHLNFGTHFRQSIKHKTSPADSSSLMINWLFEGPKYGQLLCFLCNQPFATQLSTRRLGPYGERICSLQNHPSTFHKENHKWKVWTNKKAGPLHRSTGPSLKSKLFSLSFLISNYELLLE